MVHSFRLTGVPNESAAAMHAFNRAEMARGGNRHYVSTSTPSNTPHTFHFCEVLQVIPSTPTTTDTCTMEFAAYGPNGEVIPLSAPSAASCTSPLTVLRVIERVVYTAGKCHKHGVPLVGWSRRLQVLVPTGCTTMPPPCVYLLPPDIRPDTEVSLARDVQVLARWGLHLIDQYSLLTPLSPSRELDTAKTLLTLVSTPTPNEDDTLSATGLLRELRALITSRSCSSRSPSPSYPHTASCRPSIYSTSNTMRSSLDGREGLSPSLPFSSRSPNGVHDEDLEGDVVQPTPTNVLDDTCVYIEHPNKEEDGGEESELSDIEMPNTTFSSTAPRGSLRRSSSVVGQAVPPPTKRAQHSARKEWVPSAEELTHMLGSELLRAGNGCGSANAPDGPLPPLQVISLTSLNVHTAASKIEASISLHDGDADHHYGSMSQLDLRAGVERRTVLKLAKLRGQLQGGDHGPFIQAAMVHTYSCMRTLERYILSSPPDDSRAMISRIGLQLQPLMDRVAALPNHGVNEVLLWHATSSPIAAQAIRNEGFDCRLEGAAHGHRFGQGTYFTDCCAKALEYAGTCADGGASCPLHKMGRRGKSALVSNKCGTASLTTPCSDGYHHLFLCSVVLGAPHVAKGPCPTMRRPPPITAKSTATLDTFYYDSVVGYGKAPTPTPATATGTGVFEQHAHREFVVFERGYAIPLLELRIRCTPST